MSNKITLQKLFDVSGHDKHYMTYFELCACAFNDDGSIDDYATNSWDQSEGGMKEIKRAPVNQPLMLQVKSYEEGLIEDLMVIITEPGKIEECYIEDGEVKLYK